MTANGVKGWVGRREPEVSAPENIEFPGYRAHYFCTGSDFLVWRYEDRTETEEEEKYFCLRFFFGNESDAENCVIKP